MQLFRKTEQQLPEAKRSGLCPSQKCKLTVTPSEKRAGSTVFCVYQRKYVCVYSDTVFTLILVCLLLLFKRVQGLTQDFNSHQ